MSTRTFQMDRANDVMQAAPTIGLRLARPDDAAFIVSLRTNGELNRHLSSVVGTQESQRAWLEAYRHREDAGSEFYFIISNKVTGEDCGTIRIYDLREDSFCWGSWVLNDSKTRFAAIESAIFIYEFGFGVLGYTASHFDVRRDNTRVISFHEKTGARRVSEAEQDVYFRLEQADFASHLPRLVALTQYPLQMLAANGCSKGTS